MSPRRSARADAAVELNTSALASLPLPLAHRVFLLLPVDSRARAACVCRGWRAVLADPVMWTRLDLSDKSGIAAGLDANAVLRAASARAAGRLHTLSVDRTTVHVDAALLLQVLAANADSLRELHVGDRFAYVEEPQPALEALLRTAPRLQVLGASVDCTPELAVRLMRAESPFGPLRLKTLSVNFTADYDRDEGPAGNSQAVAHIAALLSDAALQPQLEGVALGGSADLLDEPIAADAIVDAVLARELRSLTLENCKPPAAELLARLLSAGKLTHLMFVGSRGGPLFDAASAAPVADALRVNTSLCSLSLISADAFGGTSDALAVLDALVGHPNLDTLFIVSENRAVDRAAFAVALGALVAADAPALQKLTISCNALGDDGLRQVVNALPANRHLRELDCQINAMSAEFARDHLLPAVRANTGLRKLVANYPVDLLLLFPEDIRDVIKLHPAAAEAEELVHRRTALQG